MAPSALSTAAAAAAGAATTPSNGVTKGAPAYAELDASKLTYERTICTDHMITANWSADAGWAAPKLHPYGPLSLMPTASVLHYATECFEGLKVYRGFDGRLRLFRPDCNARRMLEKLMIALLAVDGARWIPKSRPGTFLYLRPTMIGTQSQLGVMASREAMLYIICSFMPIMDSPPAASASAPPRGHGPCLVRWDARDAGFHQILWLYGPEALCTEAGASNFFVLWKPKEGGKPQLEERPRAREERCPEIDVVERKYTIRELEEAYDEGRIIESFAAGTAFFICPISVVNHRGKNLEASMGASGEGGDYTLKVRQWLKDIMYGAEPDHKWAVVITEEGEE
ncbi:unnamed protein product [Parascedosporium putredinis]|uniref:Branched-chain-amino-acid transaminase n=1 Tax=Parascedosporium putredinis TaxID=1442378 RepID=A0A9P1M9J3_9PEZI|nr:unnamed protein product [Parascedosporium putredinis]CAI7995758.1 unnamed protein product [Parascedosporium putredinis]